MTTYHSTYNHVVGPCSCLAGTSVNNKDLVLRRSRFSVLTADSDHWGTGTESGCHCFKPHWLKCLPEDLSSRRTNCTFISLFFSLFGEPDVQALEHSKSITFTGHLESHAQGKTQAQKKNQEDLKFSPQTYPMHRDIFNSKTKSKTNLNKSKPWGRGRI